MIACTIAGSDSGGGAGIQADLKTFQELKVFGTSVITALTAQNTQGVHGIFPVDAGFVDAQLTAVLDDFDVKAIKTGMLFDAAIIEAVARRLNGTNIPIVVDPVMIAKGGQRLLLEEAVAAYKQLLLPLSAVCTPNIPEAEVLTGIPIETQRDIERAAHRLLETGVRCVVLKGGHLKSDKATDAVYLQDEQPFYVETDRFDTPHTHGTGCTFSAALTAGLARGMSLRESIILAKRFVDAAIKHPLNIGHGLGPTNHFAYQQLERELPVHVFTTR